MWQRLSLRSRINVLLALVLTLGLAVNVARLVLEGGPTRSGGRSERHAAGARIC